MSAAPFRSLLAVAAGLIVMVPAADALAAACVGRPTDPGGYGSWNYGDDVVDSFEQPRVRVHFTTTGTNAVDVTSTRADAVPDTVVFAAETAEAALESYEAMGFDPPPSDAACASNGGDGKLDVYLLKFGGADGHAAVDACEGRRCSTFLLVESTFKNHGYASAKEGFTTVVTHEAFHAVQNVYEPQMESFWAEGTAQWAMKTLHPELMDFEKNLPAFFAEPRRSIDSQPAGVAASYIYGAAVWPLFLTLQQGPDFVREVFERARNQAGEETALESIDAVLQSKGTSLADVFPTFGAWNVATGSLAGADGYPDAASYPGVALEPAVDQTTAATAGLGTYAYRATLAGPTHLSVVADPERNRAFALPIVEGKADLAARVELPVVLDGDVAIIVSGITAKKSDAPFQLRLVPEVAEPSTPPEADPGAAGDGGGCALAPARGSDRDHRTAPVAVASILGAVLASRARRRAR